MGSNAREMNIPTGLSVKDIIAWGTSGLVFLDPGSNTVIKTPHSEEDEGAIKIERDIYERFTQQGGHEGLLQYFGPFENGLRLEFARNQSLLSYLQEHNDEIDLEQRLRWCQEISYTLSFVHVNRVVHGDFKCNNIFLDGALHTKVGDFGGSSLDGSDLLIMVSASHRSPGILKSAEADIYALASSFYEILTGEAPYTGREEEEIMELFRKSMFPETMSLGAMGDIIQGCWRGNLQSANEVSTHIKAIRAQPFSLHVSLYNSKTIATVFAVSAICLFVIYHLCSMDTLQFWWLCQCY